MASTTTGTKRQGYTLLEMGFVIAVMGMLILLMANHFATHIRPNDAQVADEIVQDVWSVIHAARLWASRHNGFWPGIGGIIDLDALGPSGARYLTALPTTPVSGQCGRYYSPAAGRFIPLNDGEYVGRGYGRKSQVETKFVNEATDLEILFCVKGDRQFADSIASRIPHGGISVPWNRLDQFTIKTRLIGGVASRSSLNYVRRTGEDRSVVSKDIELRRLSLATSDDSASGKTRIKMNAQMDVDAGVGASSSSSDQAYFELEKIYDTIGTFNKAIPRWKIRDRDSSTNYDGIWTPIEYDGERINPTTVTYTPSASMEVKKAGTKVNDMAWTLKYFYKKSADEAVFDLYLADEDADSGDSNAYDCHRGIHTQLCEIERQLHNSLSSATFNLSDTPPYNLSGLEDAACRSYPTTCP